VSIRLEDLLQALDYRLIDEGGSIQIFDSKGQLMAASQGELVDNLDDRALILHETIPNLNWTMEAVIPSSMFDAGADKVRRLTILLCLLSTVVLLVIGVLFSSYFAKRISKIIRLIYSYREGDFHKRIAYDGNDEFGQIAVAFNEMGQNLDEMIRENYITNLRKKEAELEVLQAQINPHFLYNTLSSISRLGKLGKIDQMHEMVLALARFYRLSLNEGKIETTIEKELEHIRAYIGIQSIKYGSRLTVLYDIDSETFPYRTIRIILQPFVENILEHAWDGNQIAMKLIVRKVNNGIEFRIVDNGIGMKPSLVNGLLDPLAGKGYGIRNVDSRIKLHYSEPYGVAIKSRLGTGTSVRITIPMLEMHE
jgi:two-component system sensor histidine kinase YesM